MTSAQEQVTEAPLVDIVCLSGKMKNTTISINGTDYHADDRSRIMEMEPLDAAKLLASADWLEIGAGGAEGTVSDARDKKVQARKHNQWLAEQTSLEGDRKKAEDLATLNMQNGKLILALREKVRELTARVTELTITLTGNKPVEAQQVVPESVSVAPEGTESPEVVEASPAAPTGGEDAPGKGETGAAAASSEDNEWPDPTEDMDRAYLCKMADAYGVAYNGRIGLPKLVARIEAAMYPDGKE
jgi:hypothetical protein